jgi:hypothetical protein
MPNQLRTRHRMRVLLASGACVVLMVYGNSRAADVDDATLKELAHDSLRADIETRTQIENKNWETAAIAFAKVEEKTKLWFAGKIELTDEKLRELFATDATIWNVVLVRVNNDTPASDRTKAIVMHKDRTTISAINKNYEAGGVVYSYALGGQNRGDVLVMGAKAIPVDETNKKFGGGQLKVVVLATEDDLFRNARGAKSPEDRAAENAKTKE